MDAPTTQTGHRPSLDRRLLQAHFTSDDLRLSVPRRRESRGLRASFALVLAAAGLILLLKVDVAVEAQGVFDRGGRTAVLPAPFSGDVVELFASAGRRVRAGQRVLRLSPDAVADDVEDAHTMVALKRARIATVSSMIRTIRGRMSGKAASAPDRPDEVRSLDRQLFAAGAAVQARSADLAAAISDLEGARARQAADETVRAKRQFLVDRGLLAGTEGGVIQAQRADDVARVASARAAVTRATAGLSDARQGSGRTLDQMLLGYEDEERRILQDLTTLDREVKSAKQFRARGDVRAPFAGTIEEIEPLFLGRYFTKADSMFRIVPSTGGVSFRALVPNDRIGTVQVGDAVQIRMPSLPYSRYGVVRGRVRRVSADAPAAISSAAGAPQSGYVVYVYLTKIPPAVVPRMRAGLIGDATIVTRERRILDYLVDPLMAGLRGGLAEP